MPLAARRCFVLGLAVALTIFAVLAMASPDPLAAKQRGVVIEDPTGALDGERSAVKRAARREDFSVLVVPNRGGRSLREVALRRFSKAVAGRGKSDVLLLLVLRDRTARFIMRDPSGLRKRVGRTLTELLLEPLPPASRAANRAFRSSTAASAVFAGARELRRQRRENGRRELRIDIGWAWLRWSIPILLGVAAISLISGFMSRRRLQSFSAGVVAIRDLKPGTALISGTVEPADHLLSPITRSPCALYEYSVSELWERAENEAYGQKRKRGETSLAEGRKSVPFYLRDGSGSVLIDPDRADTVAESTFDEKVDASSPFYDVPGVGEFPLRRRADSTGIRHLKEATLPVGSEVTVLGPVEIDQGTPRVRWSRRLGPGPRHPFLITEQDPGWAEHGERRRMKRLFLVAGLSTAAALAVAIAVPG